MSDEKRIELITLLLKNHPHLFGVLFDPKDLTTMRAGPEDMLLKISGMSGGEQRLLKIAIDIWSAPYGGHATFSDILKLDDPDILAVTEILKRIAEI